MGIIFHGKLKPELRTMFWFSKYLGLVLTYNTIQYFQQCFLYLSFFYEGKAEKIVQTMTGDGKIIQINRPCDKRRVLFYYDHSTDFEVDEEFIKQVSFVSLYYWFQVRFVSL